jgi:hypothetical protein
MAKKIPVTKPNSITNMFDYVHNHVKSLNQSKIFAGIMIVIINIASKFVTFKFSKTVESYLKFTFSRDVLVFAITWMGTRDIYIALIMTLLFVIITEFLMNENSMFCCLPKSFITKHVTMLEGFNNQQPSPDEIAKAELVLAKAKNTNDDGVTDPNGNSLNQSVDTSINGY